MEPCRSPSASCRRFASHSAEPAGASLPPAQSLVSRGRAASWTIRWCARDDWRLSLFVLVHSPLLWPATWQTLAMSLEERGQEFSIRA